MAKARIKRNKKAVNPEDAKQTRKFFTVTGIIVLVLLVLLFTLYSMS